ncbi:restriction endonuclease subunit S [Bifidobacterium pseudocatenulatum]|uniref:restriction endonuclease subunit S n=1 Tax=Bifidobacterium pseudocatenulatum TaxID=28026 RepID=UPI0022E774E6|nr:restriction endonuclease subunit S [Bifidobacterium pseudocatenulatum]
MVEQHGKTLVPQIRFAGFTDPWEQRKLGELTESYSGGTPAAGESEFYGGSIPFIRSAEIASKSTELFLTGKGYESSSARMVKPGDVLYALYGATSGEVAVSKQKGAINQAILAILPHDDCDARYLAAWLRRRKDYIVTTFLQGGQGNLSGVIVKNLEVAIPSLPEQQRIGSCLSLLDSLITLHQRKYDKLCVLKKSMLDKMFPKGGSLYPEIRFAGFADPWEQRKLGEVANVCSGRDYKHLAEGPIPVYGTGGYMTSVSKALSYDEDAIGIGRKGTIDKPYRLRAPFWTVDTLFYAIPEASLDINFLLCSFLNVDWKSKDESTGLPSLSKRAINETEVLVPDIGEQRRIGAFFDRLDSLITLHQRKLELLRNIKKSMLDKMFV